MQPASNQNHSLVGFTQLAAPRGFCYLLGSPYPSVTITTTTEQLCSTTINQHNSDTMQPSTPIRPVSGTFYEAVQLLRPHPKIRPVSDSYAETRSHLSTVTPEGDRWSRSSQATAVDPPETPHLPTSRKQYEAASSRVLGSLGRLDTDVPSEKSPKPGSPSPRLMIFRTKALFSPRSSTVPKTPEGEKVHGTFCRMKSVVSKTLRRSEKGGIAEAGSRDSLGLGFYSASTRRLITKEDEEEAEETNISIISDEPHQIVPLRLVSKFLPTSTISISDNDIGSSIVVEQCSGGDKDEDDGEDSEHGSLHVVPLRLRSSNLALVSKDGNSAVETSFYYAPSAKEDDDVFSSPNETCQIDRPVTSFMLELRDAMEQGHGTKTPSIISTITASPMVTPSPSPKLRHTALSSIPSLQPISLRSQYSASEPASSPPVLSVPKMWTLDKSQAKKTVRLAPSLEEGLCADDLEVYEENALASATLLVRGVEPDVVDIRRSQVVETSERQSLAVSNYQRPGNNATAASKCISAASSNSGSSTVVQTMPFQILETIVFSAAYGDAECRTLASNLYKELVEAETSGTERKWGVREQHLLCRSDLMRELDSLVQYGYLKQDIFEMVRGQLFPTGTTELLENRDFTAYIYRAVSAFALGEGRAKQILELAIGEEDESLGEWSPEEEAFFEREPFNPKGFVYGDSTDDSHYERLSSMLSTVGTFESTKPQPQSGWRSSYFLSKVAQVFRLGHWKRTT
ncbi:hypothetical protein BU25DRAFT_410090 [Macroventuria anomochaeta]|uniref:Uncharacterized protein n=1 Tax=Macroventuria anomochaeta TaxID=301207 RepID=A0ACB6S2Q8_9PLEO|nr:uncharacterized protein BU25DRAFT_410090 [Macroventuria anomochaeta]KAF2628530.1 hypothetical protein BU25DRAFT_410090 [Macroventuria anomochaeta]